MTTAATPPIRIADVRDHNLRAVYEYLSRHPGASRSDVARAVGLSATSAGRMVETLRSAALIHEGAPVSHGIGRPQTPLFVRRNAATVAGVSIRSRHVRLHLADLDGQVLSRSESARSDEDARSLADQIAQQIHDLRATHAPAAPIAAVVVGISGVWDAEARRVYAAPNLALLEGIDFERELSDALASIVPASGIALDNDVNFALAGEHALGAAKDIDNAFYLSVGSGVGGAALVGGQVQRGAAGFAGEVGYLIVHEDGRSGTLESFLSRERIMALETAGQQSPTRDVAVAEYAGRLLGQALVAIVTTLNPRLIVLGGSLGRTASSWVGPTERHLRSYLPVTPPVVISRLGRDASLVGAVETARVLARRVLIEGGVEPHLEEA